MAASRRQWGDLRGMDEGLPARVPADEVRAVPVVAAPYGMTLGGGLEVCLGAGHVQAAAETYAGLVEVGVGLIPGGGGNMNLLWRALARRARRGDVDPYALVTQVFKNIALARWRRAPRRPKAFGYFRRRTA
jgi:3-hydroxyacyl-CoA dehydrogenase